MTSSWTDVEIVSSEDDAASAQVEAYTPPAVVEEEEESSQQIFTVVETMPEFPGGQGALLQYLAKSIKYPVIAQENGIQVVYPARLWLTKTVLS